MMTFLVVPFFWLGVLVVFSVWLWNRWRPVKVTSQSKLGEVSDSTPSALMISMAVMSGILGFFLRLYGFNRSLWLDEFGTLWTISGEFLQVIERAFSFHGQSPFYYLIVWGFVQALGVSEMAMRLPSLLFGIATGYVTYSLGKSIFSQRVGVIAASLLWLSPPMVQSSADARPYAVALFMTAIMFFGFARATKMGDRKGRWLFIAGGVGLFVTHYLLALIAVGIALAYFCLPSLRKRYSAGEFIRDVALQLLLVSWGVRQVFQLWSRRVELAWLGDPKYLAFFETIGPFIIAGSAGFFFRRFSPQSGFQRTLVMALGITLFTQIVCLELLAYFGVNLLERRYLAPIIIPAVLIGAIALEWTPRQVVTIPLAYWLLFISVSFAMNFKAYGSFSTAGFQDWRQAVQCVEKLTRADGKAPVLYRSGFVEEDHSTHGRLTPKVTFAPLQSPQKPAISWNLVPLTYTWSKLEREEHFNHSIGLVLRGASVFYFLTCAGCFNEATGKYPELLREWVEKKFPARFVADPIDAGTGITLIRFVDRTRGTLSESILERRPPAVSTKDRTQPIKNQFSCD